VNVTLKHRQRYTWIVCKWRDDVVKIVLCLANRYHVNATLCLSQALDRRELQHHTCHIDEAARIHNNN
jgi:hypothetical protein